MRQRTRQEIMRGYAKLREEKARKRRRPFQILAAVVLLGAGGKLYMTYHIELSAYAGALAGKAGKWIDDMCDPKNYASLPSDETPPPAAEEPPAEGPPVAPEGAMRAKLFPAEPRLAPEPGSDSAPPRPPRPARPKPLAKNAWRVAGAVYDLATLAPVSDATVTFRRNEGEKEAVVTDEAGAYEIDLIKGDGWTVGLLSPDHRPGQIIDLDPPYRIRDADERRATLEHISDGDLMPVPVGWNQANSKVRLDLVAVPVRWSKPDRR